MPKKNTIARGSTLIHPSGTSITTPLLVPSFSSKGFGFSDSGKSEILHYYSVAEEILTNSMLVSAYDLAQGFLPPIVQPVTDLTFVDSGGYETSDVHDLSAVFKNPVDKRPWSKEDLKKIYDGWSDNIPSVFVNYDDPKYRIPIPDQIDAAEDFLLPYRSQLRAMLIKPETPGETYVNTNNVIASVSKLKKFDIVGFTEKELGNSLLDRMKAISRIRLALDDEKMSTPIHVFGSLDPITSPLYFLAGAEIFDGLTWLRFGYGNGVASYIHNSVALNFGIDNKQPYSQALGLSANHSYLTNLQNEMKKFLLDGDFKMFKYNGEFFKDAFDQLRTRVERLK